MPRSSTDWTLEAIKTLRRFWAEGDSTATIGRRMGFSKNAIVGKAHRLNLPPRPSPITRDGPRPGKIPAQRNRTSLPPLQVMTALPGVVTSEREPPVARPLPTPPHRFKARSTTGALCCWPIGEPDRAGFGFCGDPVETLGRPYCDAHCGVAYMPKKPKQRHQAEDGHART